MILAIALTVVKVVLDWWLIEKRNIRINHALEEAIFFIVVAGGTMITLNAFFFAIAYGVKLMAFDYVLNLLRGRDWFYLSQEKKAALMDRVLRKLTKYVVLGLRLSGLAIGCWLYYK